ncbi:YggS family pyridoxal phosphate-dependent enzyme [Aquiflexum gelatinilyticum]|uniref:YggS family pyridoxal phosphate-dependent enzyme n=1 Tax=Aquiflexum gelatinilyticum TaxID=2961943 RepID=UPI0021691802|nr:YggS family pyridoxal phosphate-dependent enzyme [Aquiflexum gelatinilyticum]MCS4433232.1 YggS family pyridoxal phosphate-dependent enzyme [Aquiflexum gelatinilyticum]
MSIKENLLSLKNTFVNPACLLVAVSKTHPVDAIREAYELGVRDFGENKVQELEEKQAALPKDIRWHFIGHLQSNKVKYIAPFIYLIHGVDSLKLLTEINKQAEKADRVIHCLLQVYIAKEESKFGLDEKELEELVQSEAVKNMKNIKVVGLMGMATFTDNEEIVRQEFRYLKSIFDKLKNKALPPNFDLKEISMGMSGDFIIAQEEGSTMVRIGTAIFGEREYK